jgi:MFS family permease
MNIETSNETHEKIRLSRHIRLLIFFIFWLLHFLNCSDSGIPTASSNNIKQVLKFTDSQFGNYGSLVQLGRLTGTVIGLNILNICNRKLLILFAPFIKSITLLVYYYTNNFWIIMTCRFIQGFVTVSTYIYFPTWIEQFGLQKYKNSMINSIQTASPFGSVFGFSLCTFMGTDSWKKCFSLLAYSIMFLICILFFIPEKYFSSQIYFSRHIEISQHEEDEHVEGRGSIYSLFEKNESHIKKKSQLKIFGAKF